MRTVREMPTTLADQERAILALLRERTAIQKRIRPLLDDVEAINAKLKAIFAAQEAWPSSR
jgi:hypothetical protein